MENRERILQCAEELFCTRGYDAAGIQEIVDRAGVTKPTLYYYFGSKLGLLQAILETKFDKLRPWLGDALKKKGDIRAKLYALGRVFFRFFAEEQKFYRLLMALFYSAQENEAYQAARPYFQEIYRTVVGAFESCADELGNMRGRQRQFAISFIGVMNQYLTLPADQAGQDAPGINEEQIRILVDQFMYGIFS